MTALPDRRQLAPAETVEPQYQACLDVARESGIASLGLMTNQVWHDDPRRLTFVLARMRTRALAAQQRSVAAPH